MGGGRTCSGRGGACSGRGEAGRLSAADHVSVLVSVSYLDDV